jgi:hypothetical protein
LGAAGAKALGRRFRCTSSPLSGDDQIRTHIGRNVSAEFFERESSSPDTVVTMNRVDAEGDRLRAE